MLVQCVDFNACQFDQAESSQAEGPRVKPNGKDPIMLLRHKDMKLESEGMSLSKGLGHSSDNTCFYFRNYVHIW